MTDPSSILLHRNNPEKTPLAGHIKVTREDWLNVAREALISEGVDAVKIMPLASRLGVSRSSFYWYFDSREAFLEGLLSEWETRNTATILRHCEMPATNIVTATFNFFRCFIDPSLFNTGLEFAVRAWSRRDDSVRQRVDAADRARLAAVTAMFARNGYEPAEADARARILYYMQLGYHALEVKEPMEVRLSRVEAYTFGFTGEKASAAELEAFRAFAMGAGEGKPGGNSP